MVEADNRIGTSPLSTFGERQLVIKSGVILRYQPGSVLADHKFHLVTNEKHKGGKAHVPFKSEMA